MQYTLSLFKQLVDNIPPLFPEDLKYEIRKDLEGIKEGAVSMDELEQKMVQYGYEIWPWNQSFREILNSTEEKMGEQFLLSNLPQDLQEKYLEYRQLGLSLKDFHSGKMASYFNEEQRIVLTIALIDMKSQVKDFTIREAVGLKKDFYLKKVQEFKLILEEIKHNLNRLKDLADKEEEHENLANEIRARVESFEQGLCLLAPEFSHEEVELAHEFFVGRKKELNHLRGIHKVLEIDILSQE